MKTLVSVLVTLIATLSVMAEPAPILFRGVVNLPGAEIFSISTQDESRSAWVSVGDRFDQYFVAEFLAAENLLVIQKDDQEWRIPLAGRKGSAGDQPVISVSTLGFISKPGKIEIRGENPTLLDVWKASGGGRDETGDRLILTRTGNDGSVERQEIPLPFDSPGSELDKMLREIPLRDQDVLFFPKRAD